MNISFKILKNSFYIRHYNLPFFLNRGLQRAPADLQCSSYGSSSVIIFCTHKFLYNIFYTKIFHFYFLANRFIQNNVDRLEHFRTTPLLLPVKNNNNDNISKSKVKVDIIFVHSTGTDNRTQDKYTDNQLLLITG